MDITTEFRSHWVAADGTRHASRRGADGRKRYDLQPIINIDELRAYCSLGRMILPPGATPDYSPVSVWYAQQVIDHGPRVHPYTIAEVIGELTDDVPMYHEAWRAPFVALRERWPLPRATAAR